MAVDMFLKIGDIKGESKDSQHRDWIEVSSFSWGMSQSGVAADRPGSGAGAGKVSVQDISITKRLDKSSPLLMRSCATGQHIKEATLNLSRTKNDQQTYYVITLTDVLVSSYSPACSEGGAENVPVEAVTLNFSKIQTVYKEIDPSTNQVLGEYEATHTIKF
jgi:type VI secretion system secreted protein Hcp